MKIQKIYDFIKIKRDTWLYLVPEITSVSLFWKYWVCLLKNKSVCLFSDCGNQMITLPSNSVETLSINLSIFSYCRWVIRAAAGQRVHGQFQEFTTGPFYLHVGSLDDPYIFSIEPDSEYNSSVVSPHEVLVLTVESLFVSPQRKKRQEQEYMLTVVLENINLDGEE